MDGTHELSIKPNEPFQIISTNEAGEIVLKHDQLESLKQLYSSCKKEKDVVVFAVTGGYRIGKSSLLNILFNTNQNLPQGLHGAEQDFVVSDKRAACTKGIWVKCLELEDKLIVALDTEGTDDPRNEKDQKEMLLMTVLSMAICSEFIVNTSQTIDDTLILRLFNLVSCCENYIKIDQWKFPTLRVLVRDYKFTDSPDQLLQECLEGSSYKNEKSKISRHFECRISHILPYYKEDTYVESASKFWTTMITEGQYFDGNTEQHQTLEGWTEHVIGVMKQLEQFRKTSGRIDMHLTFDAFNTYMVDNLKKEAQQKLSELIIVKNEFQLKDDFQDIIEFPNEEYEKIKKNMKEKCKKHVTNDDENAEIKLYTDWIQHSVDQAIHTSIKRCFLSCIALRNGQNFSKLLELRIPEKRTMFMEFKCIDDSSENIPLKEEFDKCLKALENDDLEKLFKGYYQVFFEKQVFDEFKAVIAEILKPDQRPCWLTDLLRNNIKQLISRSLNVLNKEVELDIHSINIDGLKSLLSMLYKKEKDKTEYSLRLCEQRKIFKEEKIKQLKTKYISSAVSLSSAGVALASLSLFPALMPIAAGAVGISGAVSLVVSYNERKSRERQEKEIRDLINEGNTKVAESTNLDLAQQGEILQTTEEEKKVGNNVNPKIAKTAKEEKQQGNNGKTEITKTAKEERQQGNNGKTEIPKTAKEERQQGNNRKTEIPKTARVEQQLGNDKNTETRKEENKNLSNVEFKPNRKEGYMHMTKSFMSGGVSLVNTIEAGSMIGTTVAVAEPIVKFVPVLNGAFAVAEAGILAKNVYDHATVDRNYKCIDDMIKYLDDKNTTRQLQLQLVLYHLFQKHMEEIET